MKVVELEWDDHSFSFGSDTPDVQRVSTVGYLTYEDDKVIKVALSLVTHSDGGTSPNDQLVVDKRMLVRKRVLRP